MRIMHEIVKYDWKYEGSGCYLMLFDNGKKYLGSSKNINKRLKQHISAFFSKKTTDWHKDAAKTFEKDSIFKHVEFYYCPAEDYKSLEEDWLRKIKTNGYDKQYYNTIFGNIGDFRKKRVHCIETGFIFNSVTDAAKYAGCSVSAMSHVLHKDWNVCGKI